MPTNTERKRKEREDINEKNRGSKSARNMGIMGMKQNIRMSTIQNPPERERLKQNVYSDVSQTVRLNLGTVVL